MTGSQPTEISRTDGGVTSCYVAPSSRNELLALHARLAQRLDAMTDAAVRAIRGEISDVDFGVAAVCARDADVALLAAILRVPT